jgi:hypothetical protein
MKHTILSVTSGDVELRWWIVAGGRGWGSGNDLPRCSLVIWKSEGGIYQHRRGILKESGNGGVK